MDQWTVSSEGWFSGFSASNGPLCSGPGTTSHPPFSCLLPPPSTLYSSPPFYMPSFFILPVLVLPPLLHTTFLFVWAFLPPSPSYLYLPPPSPPFIALGMPFPSSLPYPILLLLLTTNTFLLFLLSFPHFLIKVLSLCHKLWFCNPYIFAIKCRKPIDISNYESCQIMKSKFEISKVYTIRLHTI